MVTNLLLWLVPTMLIACVCLAIVVLAGQFVLIPSVVQVGFAVVALVSAIAIGSIVLIGKDT